MSSRQRRNLAKVLCGDGRIRVGGLPAKAARQVRVGDRIELDFGRRQVVVEVRGVLSEATAERRRGACPPSGSAAPERRAREK